MTDSSKGPPIFQRFAAPSRPSDAGTSSADNYGDSAFPPVRARDFSSTSSDDTATASHPPPRRSSLAHTMSYLRVPESAYPRGDVVRPKAPSVRLSYRTDDSSNSNSIYRMAGGGGSTRRRSATVSGAPAVSPGLTVPNSASGGASIFSSLSDGRRTPEPSSGLQVPGDATKSVKGRRRALSSLSWRGSTPMPDEEAAIPPPDPEAQRLAAERERYDQQVIDLLDVIDPEVGTLTTLSDVQNSLFVPDLGRWVDRSRYLRITKPTAAEALAASGDDSAPHSPPTTSADATPDGERRSPAPSIVDTSLNIPEDIAEEVEMDEAQAGKEEGMEQPGGDTVQGERIEARGKYLVLPDGLVDWENWSDEDRADLDDYVRHLLHSRKWKARRTWRGFRHYVSTPLGAFVTIYATLLTVWGAAWILFIIGWLNAGGRQAYFVEICDQILTALFCVVGIGLAPFRARDTYHMIYIAHFHRKSLRLYREQGAPTLEDPNDLPSPIGAKAQGEKRTERNIKEGQTMRPVLTVEEQAKFIYHQQKFSKSHTFYRPHETTTHKAFPLDLLVVVVSLLDFHSLFQIALGSSTWSISYHHSYKSILTSVILSFSISCNITAGLVITVGNRRTRKEEVVREQLHKAVTEEAVKRRLAKEERRKDEQEKEQRRRKDERDLDLHRAAVVRAKARDEQGQEKNKKGDRRPLIPPTIEVSSAQD